MRSDVIKHTVEISQQPVHLTVRHKQLLLLRDGENAASLPCEDLGVVLVDHPGTTYSHAALMAIAESEAVLVVCGRNHLPSAVLLPISSHSQVVWRINEQLGASKPLKKRLWAQIVQAKVRAQAFGLPSTSPGHRKLLELAKQIRSGDPENVEAQAARVYWGQWCPCDNFKRDANGDGVNGLLNYGYAVLRAAVARALVAAGLLPALGLHHSNRANAFCLADDLMEPIRPLVDDRVRDLCQREEMELTPATKAQLLSLLAEPVQFGGQTGPLMNNLHRYAFSLVCCYQGKSSRLEIPTRCSSADTVVCGS